MSHNCGHEAHDHDHEHHEHGPNDSHDQIGQGDWLYTKIDREHVKAYNSDHDGANVVKPYDERMDEQVVSSLAVPSRDVRRCPGVDFGLSFLG
jgi:hypothetical protein